MRKPVFKVSDQDRYKPSSAAAETTKCLKSLSVDKNQNLSAQIQNLTVAPGLEYRVIALISANIVPILDIEGREVASDRRYPKEEQY